jgi:hypothetical protein
VSNRLLIEQVKSTGNNFKIYPTNSHPHLPVVHPVLTNQEMTTQSQRYNCFSSNGGNAILKHAGSEDKGGNPTAGLTLLWASNTFRGHFKHWQVSQKEAEQIFLNAYMDIKKVSLLKYAAWNVRELAGKEGELVKILNNIHLQISVITESKKKLQGTKETEHYTVIYSGVQRLTRGHSGVMIWVHMSI